MDNGFESDENEAVDTLAVHAGALPQTSNAPSSPPLFQASSYEFADLAEIEEIYAGNRPGSVYGRYGGPNGAHFESALAELEGSEASVGAASGMAAIAAVLTVSVPPGAPIVCARDLYGGTNELLENDFQLRENRRVRVDITDLEAVEAGLASTGAPLLYAEALSNPLMRVADLPALAGIARRNGARLAVDATFASPALCRPIAMGADLVIHSVGKYLGGHGDVGAGAVSGAAALCAPIRRWLIRNGATIPHFEAWLALRGMRTLGLRMARHAANAAAAAAYLSAVDRVSRVHHPSLAGHPEHALAQRLYPRGTGGIVAFDLNGGAAAVDAFLRGLEMIAIVHSLGEVASTISYSARSSHRSLTPEERAAAGVTDATLRLSCGIEDPADIVADLGRAFARLRDVHPARETRVSA